MVQGNIRLATADDRERIYQLDLERSLKCNKTIDDVIKPALYFVFDADYVGVIGVVGVEYSEELKGYEVTTARVKKEYEKNGIMSLLIKSLCGLIDNELYGDCWRVHGNSRCNAQRQVDDNDFKLIHKEHKSFCSDCNKCTGKFKGADCCAEYEDGCTCCLDLYKRDIQMKSEQIMLSGVNILQYRELGVVKATVEIRADGKCVGLHNLSYRSRRAVFILIKRVASQFSCSVNLYVNKDCLECLFTLYRSEYVGDDMYCISFNKIVW